MSIITRFAPSPTSEKGGLHIGGARTALFSWLHAKRNNGQFVFRIEDTDLARSNKDCELQLVKDMQWLGLDWDFGPEVPSLGIKQKGPHAYRQSTRLGYYHKLVSQLVEKDLAYEQDGAVFFRMPKVDYTFNDMILGEIVVPAEQAKDFVIKKKDGFPTFHLAVVADDAEMGITHIFRGQDHLSNTPKHLALYKALDFKYPEYAHMPLILNMNGSKMSKRQEGGNVYVGDFRKEGFLAESVINYISLLGWSPESEEDTDFGMRFLIDNFDISRVGKANARFDVEKMLNLNSAKLRSMDKKRFLNISKQHLEISDDSCDGIINVCHGRTKKLSDITKNIGLIRDNPTPDDKIVDKFLLSNDKQGLCVLKSMLDMLEMIDKWSKDEIMTTIKMVANKKSLSLNKIIQPVRVALVGGSISPPIDDTLCLIGQPESLRRMKSIINVVS